jgi:hypothetical protein
LSLSNQVDLFLWMMRPSATSAVSQAHIKLAKTWIVPPAPQVHSQTLSASISVPHVALDGFKTHLAKLSVSIVLLGAFKINQQRPTAHSAMPEHLRLLWGVFSVVPAYLGNARPSPVHPAVTRVPLVPFSLLRISATALSVQLDHTTLNLVASHALIVPLESSKIFLGK